MTNSEHLEEFLNFLRGIQEKYQVAVAKEMDADKETQDILHRLELNEDTDKDMMKIVKIIKDVRHERREAKDIKIHAEPIILWLKENEKVIKSLERLLGDVRKAEKRTENRYYIPKTDILANILKGEGE